MNSNRVGESRGKTQTELNSKKAQLDIQSHSITPEGKEHTLNYKSFILCLQKGVWKLKQESHAGNKRLCTQFDSKRPQKVSLNKESHR